MLQYIYYGEYDILFDRVNASRIKRSAPAACREMIRAGRMAGGSAEGSGFDLALKFNSLVSLGRTRAQMWVIANKYGMNSLKEVSLQDLKWWFGTCSKGGFFEACRILADYIDHDVGFKADLVKSACRLGSNVLEDVGFHKWLSGDIEALAIAFEYMRAMEQKKHERCMAALSTLRNRQQEVQDLQRENARLKRPAENDSAHETPPSKKGPGRRGH